MSCTLCQWAQGDGFRTDKCLGIDKVEECPTGEMPKLSPKNRGFWFLFMKILPGLMDGYGAFKFEAIKFIMDEYQVDPGQRPIIHEKCLVAMGAIREVRNEEEEQRKAQGGKT